MGIRVTHGANGGNRPTNPMPRSAPGKPFGMPITPFDPQTGKYLALGPKEEAAGAAVEAFTVVIEYGDYLLCTNSDGEQVNVAKPYALRQTPFDGLEVNGVTYVYSQPSVRVASADGESDEEQVVTPDYYNGEEILATSYETGVVDGGGEDVEWGDINSAGRSWAVEP